MCSQCKSEYVKLISLKPIRTNSDWYFIDILIITLQPTLGSDNSQRMNLPQRSGIEAGSSTSKSMPSVGASIGTGQVFTDIGYHKGVNVALKHIKKDHLQVTRDILLEFNDVSIHS